MKLYSKSVLIALTVNIFENYCVALYSFYCTFLSPYIFPEEARTLINLPFILHGLQFFMKPLSALLFGYMGDKYGRRYSLIYGVLCITVPTLCIAFIPNYETIGVTASVIFSVCLCIQAIGTSAAFTGGAVYINELVPDRWKSSASSIFYGSIFLGVILMNVVGIILQKMMYISYVWRAAYVLGGIFTIISLYFRQYMKESPIFKQEKQNSLSFKIAMKKILSHPRNFLATIAMGGAATMPYYFLMIYLNKFLLDTLHISPSVIFNYNLYTLVTWLLLMITFGWISTFISGKQLITINCILLCIVSVPVYFLFNTANCVTDIFWIRLIISIPAAGIVAPCTSFIATLFHPAIRQQAFGLGYFLGGSIFGGFGPFLADILVKNTHILGSSCILLIVSGVLGLTCRYMAKPFQSD